MATRAPSELTMMLIWISDDHGDVDGDDDGDDVDDDDGDEDDNENSSLNLIRRRETGKELLRTSAFAFLWRCS